MKRHGHRNKPDFQERVQRVLATLGPLDDGWRIVREIPGGDSHGVDLNRRPEHLAAVKLQLLRYRYLKLLERARLMDVVYSPPLYAHSWGHRVRLRSGSWEELGPLLRKAHVVQQLVMDPSFITEYVESTLAHMAAQYGPIVPGSVTVDPDPKDPTKMVIRFKHLVPAEYVEMELSAGTDKGKA